MPGAAVTAASGPPIIALNGDNPATIQVGTTYADLGARIIAPQQDLNLGIHLYLDGAGTNAVQLDTTKPGTHKVDDVVTDQYAARNLNKNSEHVSSVDRSAIGS